MKKFFEKYVWVFEFVGAAILIAFGLVMKFVPISLLYIVGTIFIILGLFRVFPLVKTTKDKVMKWIFSGEIVLNIIVGAYLIYLGTKGINNLGKIFGYLIGAVLYLRAFIYFFATTIRKETTDTMMFFSHIVFITFGSLIIGNGGFNLNTLSWFILALAIISALFIAFRGYKDYRNYRFQLVIKESTKEITGKKEKNTEENIIKAPSKDESNKKDTVIGDPEKEEKGEINA